MATLQEVVDDFLAQKRIAVAGVSRRKHEAANAVYRKLRGAGYEVFPVNPNAAEVEGDRCYPDLASIPGGVDAVVAATAPAVTERIVRDCAALGIARVWMHRSFGRGSVSPAAVDLGREQGVTVIPGGCPMMFVKPVDLAHRCLCWVLRVTGGLPKQLL
ncbi:MAG: CoA-binding protein [Planctomycetota bacterium]|jgi:predicted CoA-binding protein